MTRKFIIVAALAGALAVPAVSAHAQDAPPPQGTMRPGGGGPGMRGGPGGQRGNPMMRAMKGIDLSAAQKDSLKAVEERFRPQMEAAWKDNNGDREAMRTKMMELQKSHTAAIRGVLTADQQKVFDKNAEDQKKEMQERMKHRGSETPPPPPQG